MTMIILMSIIVLLSFKAECGMKQAGICRLVCTGGDCITVNQDRVDFRAAEAACRDRSGELLTLRPETDESILHTLSQELSGNFWIGLRLPTGACSNLSSPLRGYEWISGSTLSFIPSPDTWRHSTEVCFPHCVSLSNDQKWTERLCSEETDGYLCRTQHKDACLAQELSDPTVFQSSKGCSTGPCEHKCTDVKGGYKCSCSSGYIPDSKDPRRCKMHCDKSRCPKICDGAVCSCPDGYIIDKDFCEDIDECGNGRCDHGCKNTLGDFECTCSEGFVLEGKYQCIEAKDRESFFTTTPVSLYSTKPAADNTLKTSPATAGGFLWVWVVAAVAVVVLIFVVRFYVVRRQKRREQSPAPVDNNEC
ncbi:thrombomodulin-like [Paralichthys olivaceus]|uniref:thrombomodulin-like n=1 Tax=Paralichthys olivaceus TaxID=8255 RepID=UPI003752B41D